MSLSVLMPVLNVVVSLLCVMLEDSGAAPELAAGSAEDEAGEAATTDPYL